MVLKPWILTQRKVIGVFMRGIVQSCWKINVKKRLIKVTVIITWIKLSNYQQSKRVKNSKWHLIFCLGKNLEIIILLINSMSVQLMNTTKQSASKITCISSSGYKAEIKMAFRVASKFGKHYQWIQMWLLTCTFQLQLSCQ